MVHKISLGRATSFSTAAVLSAFTFVTVVLSGCGSSSSPGTTSTPQTPRTPPTGDLRFQQVGSVSWASQGAGNSVYGHVTIYDSAATNTSDNDFVGSPLYIGPAAYTCVLTQSHDCAWAFLMQPLASQAPILNMSYAADVYGSLQQDLAAIPANSVVTSLDIPAGADTFAVAITQGTSSSTFDMQQEIVAASAAQSTVAADAAKSRVVTAVSFDTAGMAHVLSYGWQGDTTTVYDTTTYLVTPANISSTVQTISAAGFILTAFGGNPTNGYLLIGTKVHGDTAPRPVIVFMQSSTSTPSIVGYAPVALLHYDSPQSPGTASNLTYVYQK